MSKQAKCKHATLQHTPSPFAELAGYEQPSFRVRTAAKSKSGRAPPTSRGTSTTDASQIKESQKESQTFPAPLVLPHDALNYDPEGDEGVQTFRSWLQEKARNKITPERKTLYVAAPPKIDEKVSFMSAWTNPSVNPEEPPAKRTKIAAKDKDATGGQFASPTADETIAYLRAFYHGMDVKRLPTELWWVPWNQAARNKRTVQSAKGIPKHVALSYGDNATRIRARPAPDGAFPAQLNLDDILDAAIAMLPADAYAIVLLVDHDIYESPNDDFCAGRAYGGSRVSVVQSARYNPLLDARHNISASVNHAWPMSHCKSYVDELCAVEDVVPKPPTATETRLSKNGPMHAAAAAASAIAVPNSTAELEALWSSRVLRTVSHELGHCLCLAHCLYYACILQSTASLLEDTRQPPYLCPVCDSKISYGIACELLGGSEEDRARWIRDRYAALKDFCDGGQRRKTVQWAGFGAWLRSVLKDEQGEL